MNDRVNILTDKPDPQRRDFDLNYDDDAATRTASFMLPEPLSLDEKFDAAFYEAMLR
jgi:hypothetical protein